MSVGYLLDKDDKERTNRIHFGYYAQSDLSKIREELLGRTISTHLLDEKSVLLTGPNITTLEDASAFLFFHKHLSLQLCPRCPPARNPEILKPLLDRGLVSIFMIGPFGRATVRFQNLALQYPEYFIGPHTYDALRFGIMQQILQLNKEVKVKGHEVVLENHYCHQCVYERVRPSLQLIENLEPSLKHKLEVTAHRIMNLPSPIAEEMAGTLLKIASNPNEKTTKSLGTEVSLSDYFVSCRALGARPQMNNAFLNHAKFFSSALRLKMPTDMNELEYLDIASKYRNRLSAISMEGDELQSLKVSREINEEIDSIYGHGVKLFLYRFLPLIPSLVIELVRRGTYETEAVAKTRMEIEGSSIYGNMRTKTLARYFGISNAALHVWSIRNELKRKRKSLAK